MFLAAVDKMKLLGYNYNVINYGVIIKSEAYLWHSETIHLTIKL